MAAFGWPLFCTPKSPQIFIRPILTLAAGNPKITKLRPLSVPVGYVLTRIKREPGANPGLSRSCKRLHVCETAYSTMPLSASADGKANKLGLKPEDLP